MIEILLRIVLTLGSIFIFGTTLLATWLFFGLMLNPIKYNMPAETDISSRILNGFMGGMCTLVAFIFGLGIYNILFNWEKILQFIK